MAADHVYWKYWARVRSDSADRVNCCRLSYHCIDVAAVQASYANPLRIDKELNQDQLRNKERE